MYTLAYSSIRLGELSSVVRLGRLITLEFVKTHKANRQPLKKVKPRNEINFGTLV